MDNRKTTTKKTAVKSKTDRRRNKRPTMWGISRIDSGYTHGWFVRAYKEGRTYSKLFSDSKIGGKNKALKAAKEHRDKLFSELGKALAV
jgi:hypothetical protein